MVGRSLRLRRSWRRRSGWRGGRARAARAGCRPRRRVRKAPRRCSSGTRPRVIAGEVVAERRRAAAGSRSSPAACQLQQQVGELAGRAGEDPGVAGVRVAREGVEALPAGRRRRPGSSSRNTTRSPKTCSGSSARPAAACSARISATMARAWSASCGVTNTTSAARATSRYGHASVRQGGDDGLALRRPGRDRGALDAEVPALEVDVVQLVAVDEAAGGGVADLRVVLPAVPEPAHHLDVVGGLVEQLGDQLAGVRVVQVVEPSAGSCGGRSARPRSGGPRPGPAARRGRCSRSRGWRSPWRCGTARCGWRPRSAPARCAGSAGRPGRRSARRRAGRAPGRCGRPAPGQCEDCRPRASSMVTKSSRPRSASATRSTQ